MEHRRTREAAIATPNTVTLNERLAHARSRLENAERIGRPAHIARCRHRLEGLLARTDRIAQGGQ